MLNLTQPMEGVALSLAAGGAAAVLLAGAVLGAVLLTAARLVFPKARVAVLIAGTVLLLSYPVMQWNLFSFIASSIKTSRIYEDYYTVPHVKSNQRNLILLVLESYEKSFQNKKVFGENLLPKLTQIQNENTSFDGFYQLKQTSWTITALMSALCGVPLKLNSHFINLSSFREFMPNLVCYPEQLAREGYENVFMKAAAIQFTGTNHFALRHGFKKAVGFKELKDKYSDSDESEWGLNDKTFYRAVKDELTRLSQTGKPFFLTAVQVGTHQPAGHLHSGCSPKYHDYRDAVLCSDTTAADLIEWIKKQPFYQNTTIAVTGDHLAFATNIDALIQKIPHREIYLTVINPAAERKVYPHRFTNLDIAPTVLDALGAEFDGKYGLGRSLYRPEKTLYELLDNFEFLLALKSEKYASFGSGIITDIFDTPEKLQQVFVGDTVVFSKDLYEKAAARGLREIVLNQFWTDGPAAEIKINTGSVSKPFLLRFNLQAPLFGVSEKTIAVSVNGKKQAEWVFNKTSLPETVLKITPALIQNGILTLRFDITGKATAKRVYTGVLFNKMSLEEILPLNLPRPAGTVN